MSEIDQLWADIATLKEAKAASARLGFDKSPSFDLHLMLGKAEHELAKLEAEAAAKADRWAGAKKTLDVFEYHLKHGGENAIVHADVLHYARHLEHRVAELEKQLAKRPVVWQLRDRKSGEVRLVGDFGRKYAAIYSDAEIEYLKTLNGWVAFTNDFAIEPYTGEQS